MYGSGWRKRKKKKLRAICPEPGLFIPEKSITFISRGEPPAQHDFSGTCSAAGLIKALATAMTRCSWPLSRCSRSSSCPLFHSATVLPKKKNKMVGREGVETIVGDFFPLFFHFILGACGYNFRCGVEALQAERIWGKTGKRQPYTRDVVVKMGGML